MDMAEINSKRLRLNTPRGIAYRNMLNVFKNRDTLKVEASIRKYVVETTNKSEIASKRMRRYYELLKIYKKLQ